MRNNEEVAEMIVNTLESMYFLETVKQVNNDKPIIYMSERLNMLNYDVFKKTLIGELTRLVTYGHVNYKEKNEFLGFFIPENEKQYFYKKDFTKAISEALEILPLAFYNLIKTNPEVFAISIIKSMPDTL